MILPEKEINENITMISVSDVSIMFNKSSEKIDSIKEYVIKLFKRQLMFEEFWALKHINMKIKKGEFVGIIGLNGSGKSTLLKTVAGVLSPTEGEVTVNGNIAPLIELGAGFDLNLSARENVYLNGAVLGKTRKEMSALFNDIIDFAELWEFVDTPIKNYSSGMLARLGFAIATSYIPDILIVDEILSVGDFLFQQKCEKKMEEILSHGTTVLFVSHNIDQVKQLCNRVIWLQKGELVMDGDSESVCNAYLEKR